MAAKSCAQVRLPAEEIQVGLKEPEPGGVQRARGTCPTPTPGWHSRCRAGLAPGGLRVLAVGLEADDSKRQAGNYIQKG